MSRSDLEKPISAQLRVHRRFLEELSWEKEAIDGAFIQGVSRHIQAFLPHEPLSYEGYAALPKLTAIQEDLTRVVELSLSMHMDVKYLGIYFPSRALRHALRLRHPHARLPEGIQHSLRMLGQEHLLHFPACDKTPV
jgi:hypothetical protein